MTIEAWALFCLTETLLCLNPGPSCLLVVSLGLTRGRLPAVLASAGVIAANAVYFALSATGLAAVHSLSAEAFTLVKWAGAAYLIWVGTRMILRSFRPRGPEPAAPPAASKRRSFAQGFVCPGGEPEPPGLLRRHPSAVHRSRRRPRSPGVDPRGELLRDRVHGAERLRGPRREGRPPSGAALPSPARARGRRPARRSRSGAREAAAELSPAAGLPEAERKCAVTGELAAGARRGTLRSVASRERSLSCGDSSLRRRPPRSSPRPRRGSGAPLEPPQRPAQETSDVEPRRRSLHGAEGARSRLDPHDQVEIELGEGDARARELVEDERAALLLGVAEQERLVALDLAEEGQRGQLEERVAPEGALAVDEAGEAGARRPLVPRTRCRPRDRSGRGAGCPPRRARRRGRRRGPRTRRRDGVGARASGLRPPAGSRASPRRPRARWPGSSPLRAGRSRGFPCGSRPRGARPRGRAAGALRHAPAARAAGVRRGAAVRAGASSRSSRSGRRCA